MVDSWAGRAIDLAGLSRLDEPIGPDNDAHIADAADAPGQDKEQRDVTTLRSSPGVGRIVVAALLAEASEALQQRDYQALRCLSGVAPVTKRSGKSCIVLMRQAADVRLRNAVYH